MGIFLVVSQRLSWSTSRKVMAGVLVYFGAAATAGVAQHFLGHQSRLAGAIAARAGATTFFTAAWWLSRGGLIWVGTTFLEGDLGDLPHRSGPVRLVFGVLLATVAIGCRKPEKRPQKDSRSLAASAATVVSPAVSSAPARSGQPQQDPAAVVVLAWSNALDRHDLATLETLYGDPLRFYGRTLTKAAVIGAKAAAFRKQPTFRQQIVGPIVSSRADDGALTATFMKRSGEDGKLTEVAAKLVLRFGDAGTWAVVEEGDALGAPAASADACEEQVAKVVNALPEVKRTVAEAQALADKSGGRATFGGMGPTEDEGGGFSALMGLYTDERFETLVSYSVDGKGRLTVNAGGAELELPIATRRSVERACRR